MKILVVAAHPDDEVLGCGGTIARLSHEGHETHILILGEGNTSRYARREQADPAAVEALQACSRRVGKLLGASDVSTHNLPDNRFDTVPFLDVVKIAESLISRLCPDVIYTHHGGDLNIDHVAVHRAVLTATRPIQGQSVRDIYAFEVPSSTEWSFQRMEPIFRPNVFVNIGNTLKTKIQALSYYETEARKFPHPRSAQALGAIAQRWGSVVGCGAAEAFELIRSVR
jgi:LmbE family N-acetylglucosaminyl deacetylase